MFLLCYLMQKEIEFVYFVLTKSSLNFLNFFQLMQVMFTLYLNFSRTPFIFITLLNYLYIKKNKINYHYRKIAFTYILFKTLYLFFSPLCKVHFEEIVPTQNQNFGIPFLHGEEQFNKHVSLFAT